MNNGTSPRQDITNLQTPPSQRNHGSPKLSPILGTSLTPAQKNFMDEYYKNQQDRQNARITLGNVLIGHKQQPHISPLNLQGTNQKIQQLQQKQQKHPQSQIHSTTSSVGNLSMKNANKTINISKDNQIFQNQQINTLKNFFKMNEQYYNVTSNQLSINNMRPIQQNQYKPTSLTAGKIKVISKSPPQHLNSNGALPQMFYKSNLQRTNSYIKSRQSYDAYEDYQNRLNEYSSYEDINESTTLNPRKQSSQTILNESSTTQTQTLSSQNSQYNPTKVKLKLKSSSASNTELKDKEVVLDKAWLHSNIPHISTVISDVRDDECVEITINCHVESFDWILSYLQASNNKYDDYSDHHEVLYNKITDENCLNLIVSLAFLGLQSIYEKIWRLYFRDNIVSIINKCSLNLNTMNKKILQDIAEKIDDEVIEMIKERKDKFISQLYKAKVEIICGTKYKIVACKICNQVLDKKNMKIISCIPDSKDANINSYITANGRQMIRHQLDKGFNIVNFICQYRDKFRICWKEIYYKLKSIVSSPFFCQICNTWFTPNQLATCRRHESQPINTKNKNEYLYVCCMNQEPAFNGCNYQQNNGCVYDFHSPLFENDEQLKSFQWFQYQWLLIKDQLPQEICDKIQNKYKDIINFFKPQSLNYNNSFSKFYGDIKITQYQDNQYKLQLNDDTLYRVPEACKQIYELQKDSNIREQLIKKVTLLVRSKSPENQQQENLIGNQIRITLDADCSQLSIKKRSLSPQQIKEVQNFAKKRIWETKQDIIREDDLRSMRVLSKLLQQQRDNEGIQSITLQKPQAFSRNKDNSQDFFINISQISDMNRTQRGKDSLILKKSNNSQERKKGSPQFVIKQKQILRRASPPN